LQSYYDGRRPTLNLGPNIQANHLNRIRPAALENSKAPTSTSALQEGFRVCAAYAGE
jgi:hypothetical protein